ncbi:hypothetical protein TRAPUB_11754 [Trametes pubescens]|uniref:F-box domain-containing protein n=1 Tax=Trametes pubescens TaxID=154538 RepID=A0A1M2VW46_TRAPU|nr:hypothetical protein TRAPUB_11754 [Trametes pubescens]
MMLDLDICAMVLDHLDRRADITAFMRASRLFSTVGARRLLHTGVTLRTGPRLDSFSRFMLRDLDARAPSLRRLVLSFELLLVDDEAAQEGEKLRNMPRVAAQLARVLRHTTNLQHLTIHFCEELLQREEALVGALVGLESVTHLTVSSYGIRTHDVVTGIRSPLVHVNVDCYTKTQHDINLMQTLARHRDTLETVTAWGVNLSAQFLAQDDADDAIVFPRVHALSIRSSLSLDRAALVRAFPNVRTLEVADVRLPVAARPPGPLVAAAQQLAAANHQSKATWAHLNHLCGDGDALFMLGLGLRAVRRVDMEGRSSRYGEALAAARPTHLVLHSGFKNEHRNECRSLLFRLNRAITHLGIDLCPKTHALDDTMEPLVKTMQEVRNLAFVAVRLRAVPLEEESPYGRDDPRHPEIRRYLHPIEGSDGELGATELSDWVGRMAQAAPALRYVSFDLEGYPPCYFRILAPGVVGILEPDEGEAVVRRKGMEWRRREPRPPRFEEGKILDKATGQWG